MYNIKNLSVRSLLCLHFSICSLGLLGIAAKIALTVAPALVNPINAFINYVDWAEFSSTPTKPSELLQYGLSVVALAIYSGAAIFVTKKSSHLFEEIKRIWISKEVFIIYLGFSLALNLGVFLVKGRFTTLILAGIWFLFLFWPLYNRTPRFIEKERSPQWKGVVIAIFVLTLGLAFFPYMGGRLPITNDYFDIPEQTILSTGVVDNIAYINNHNIGGIYKRDPRILQSGTQDLQPGSFIPLHASSVLSRFAQDYPETFTYEDSHGALVVLGKMTEEEAYRLARIVEPGERVRVYDFFYAQLKQNKKTYSPEEIEFVKKNRKEFQDQVLAGHYFHHQNTMLGTINDYFLGKPQSETVFLYGWLSTITIAEFIRAMGGLTFENYQTVFYSFYPAYYLLVLVAACFIFKRSEYVLLTVALALGSLFSLGFENIRFAPGFNPVRHFCDIFTLVCFYWYLFKPQRNLLYLGLSLAFAFLAILCNKEFGSVLLLALIATVIVRAVSTGSVRQSIPAFFLLAVVSLGAITALKLIPVAKNPTLLYVLFGVAAPSMNPIYTYSVLVIFSAVYMTFLRNKDAQNGWCYLSLFWFFYAQGLLIYFVWNPSMGHLWSLGAIWGLSLILFFRYCVSNFSWIQLSERKILQGCFAAAMAFFFLPNTASYFLDKLAYYKIFQDHPVYRWDLPRARISTTMQPGVFTNAVDLIDKYAKGKSIFILSKYDNLLPFLAGKYSAMPYQEMALSLVTEKEMQKSVETIQSEHPEYLFVDSDMTRNHEEDVFMKEDAATIYLDAYDASRGRAMVLNNFAKVFKKISPLYEPVEAGQLITVYKRREP